MERINLEDWNSCIYTAKSRLNFSLTGFLSKKQFEEVVNEAKLIMQSKRFWKLYKSYSEYLKSERWLELRKEVFEKNKIENNGECSYCTQLATEVHHSTYDYILTEKEIEYLTCVCNYCHEELHKSI